MKIGVLALQGAFIEHEKKLLAMGYDASELRCRRDLDVSLDGIVLPGGESTVQMKLLKDNNMFDTIKDMIKSGVPVLGTCAGLILLSERIENQEETGFGTMPIIVRRNAYGRQKESFHTTSEVAGVGPVPMTFIRAPLIVGTGEEVEILSRVDDKPVAVRYHSQYGLSFHPELEKIEDAEWIYRLLWR